MWDFVLPALFALFVWWFSTGAIIYLDGLPQRTFKWSLAGATAVFGASLYGLSVTAHDATVAGAYWAFTFGLLAWGWQEISFYMGYVTGPRKDPCPEGCRGWAHFGHAIQTSLYHELAIIASAVAVVWLTWGGPNQVGMWTFMVLWWMHQSAKLNVFLGVRNLNEEFIPEHLAFLKGFLTKRAMNLLFPISVTVSTVILTLLAQAALDPQATRFEAVGFTFLAVLMALAILEHWFLVLPMPSAALWHWGLKSRQARQPFDVDIAAGFLGAGKTTFLSRMLAGADPSVRTVALVNDFSELGLDGTLLSGRGADVVELPNGCICCSLRKDLAAQLKDVIDRFGPQRVVIEPSGVADVAALLGKLRQPDLAPLLKSLRLYTLIDAGTFLRDYARMSAYFEAQADLAPVFVVNKVDLIGDAELAAVTETLRALNPGALIVPARYGVVSPGALAHSRAAEIATALPAAETDETADAPAPGRHEHHHGSAHMSHSGEAPELRSWSTRIAAPCDTERLRALLDGVADGDYGEVERLKGIARAGSGWIRFDVAGGRSHLAAFAPRDEEQPRVVAIGRAVNEARLQAAFDACTAKAAEAA